MAGKAAVFIGFAAIAAVFLAYSRYQNSELITPEALDDILRLAYGFYIVFAASVACIAYGLFAYHRHKLAEGPKKGRMYTIAVLTGTPKARKVFAVTFVAYGMFFVFTSGTLVYQPEVDFSYHYGAKIPSTEIIPCCDAPGYMPKILVYLHEHAGLQIIPLNLVLQLIVTYLVAFNTAMAISAASISKRKKGIIGAGAVTGFFIACPTCVGSLLSVVVGTAGGIILAAALVHFQTLFIAASIPILLLMPLIMASRIGGDECAIRD